MIHRWHRKAKFLWRALWKQCECIWRQSTSVRLSSYVWKKSFTNVHESKRVHLWRHKHFICVYFRMSFFCTRTICYGWGLLENNLKENYSSKISYVKFQCLQFWKLWTTQSSKLMKLKKNKLRGTIRKVLINCASINWGSFFQFIKKIDKLRRKLT